MATGPLGLHLDHVANLAEEGCSIVEGHAPIHLHLVGVKAAKDHRTNQMSVTGTHAQVKEFGQYRWRQV